MTMVGATEGYTSVHATWPSEATAQATQLQASHPTIAAELAGATMKEDARRILRLLTSLPVSGLSALDVALWKMSMRHLLGIGDC
ncbi:hypothetical protein JNJ66_06865 [Candidatus Saccharibacteria bacterium]|nr:hypothetical protein [Candidatus Saccharibacteria bacterium]